MIVRFESPPPPLSEFVECFWFHQGYSADHKMEKLLPDGAIEWIINLRDETKKLFDSQDHSRFQSFEKSWISGQHRDFIVIEAADESCMIGIRFRPGGAFPFFPFPIAELNGSVVPLDLILGSSVHSLRDRLLETPTVDGKFAHLASYLLRLAGDRLSPDRFLRFALNRIVKVPESVIVSELAQSSGISQKQLARKFHRKVGLRPKALSRVLKFQKVLELIEKRRAISWTDLAYDCGYYDQSHFIREFQSFSGTNPTRYLVEKGEYLNYVPII